MQELATPRVQLRRRSAQLEQDPKAKEMKHFLGSKKHEDRLKRAAGLRDRPKTPNSMIQRIETLNAWEKEDMGQIVSSPISGNFEARLQWRDEVDRRIRRLMQDTEFALEDNILDDDRDRLRCGHLDKMFEWFNAQAKKEAVKEREAPPYLRFDANAPVMPGSLRRDPNQFQGFIGPGAPQPAPPGRTSIRPTISGALPSGLLSAAAREVVQPQERLGTASSKRPPSSHWHVPSVAAPGSRVGV